MIFRDQPGRFLARTESDEVLASIYDHQKGRVVVDGAGYAVSKRQFTRRMKRASALATYLRKENRHRRCSSFDRRLCQWTFLFLKEFLQVLRWT